MSKPALQRTVAGAVEIAGVGLHTGADCRISILPAGAGAGFTFRRTDIDGAPADIAAAPENVVRAHHGTTIANADGVTVATIEHLMAAFALVGVDNALIEVDGPEIPILDGSAAPFVRALAERGLTALSAPRRTVTVTAPVTISDGDRTVTIEPFAGRRIDIEIKFDDCLIGLQTLSLDLDDPAELVKLAASRTFCRLGDVAELRAAGLIQGGSLANSLVVDGDRLLNDEPLRDAAEFALHKALDLIGDLYLIGAPFEGRIRAVKPGHDLNVRAARALSRRVFGAATAAREPLRAAG